MAFIREKRKITCAPSWKKPAPEGGQKKPGKYGNIPTVVDGLRFDSKGEADHWKKLRDRQHLGEISNLRRQVRFSFPINGENLAHSDTGNAISYVADFVYCENGRVVVADYKGFATPEYRLKSALMWAVHRIRVLEVKGAGK